MTHVWSIICNIFTYVLTHFPDGSDGKEPDCNETDPGSIPWIDRRREWQPTPVFLPGEFYGQRRLPGYSLWGCKESDTAERLTHHNENIDPQNDYYNKEYEYIYYPHFSYAPLNPSLSLLPSTSPLPQTQANCTVTTGYFAFSRILNKWNHTVCFFFLFFFFFA